MEKMNLSRVKAYEILTKHLKNKNLIKHCLATEATMKALYKRLSPIEKQTLVEEEKWGITGLLHDGDYEVAQKENKLDQHGSLLFDELEINTIPKDIERAIRSHNFTMTKVEPISSMDWAITCCDQLTGLIVACALVHPDKLLGSLTVEFIEKRFKEKSFAKGADRQMIGYCEDKLDIKLPEFIQITLIAMQNIHSDLGL